MAKRYLLKAWQPSRGTSEDNPAYYAGPGNYSIIQENSYEDLWS